MGATAIAAPQRHVICMKWGRKYGPESANRLYAMVRRHLSGDFNLVCLTDDSSGIRTEAAHHRGIDVLHGDRRYLSHNGRDAAAESYQHRNE